MRSICDDLVGEHDDLDRIVASIGSAEWLTATPSPGWDVRDQISHLWFFDQRAVMALTDPEAFAADVAWLVASGGTDASVAPGREIEPGELLERWRIDRARLVTHAASIDPASRVLWYGPPMAARSFVTARLMETWAHGQDICDALGVNRHPTARLRHVAHLGVRSRPFSYALRRRAMPADEIAVRLHGPHGEVWEWGPADRVGNLVTGPALDFCLVVTQRRHLDDTALTVTGPAAIEWMSIAQAFAGEPGSGRRPGQFAVTDP